MKKPYSTRIAVAPLIVLAVLSFAGCSSNPDSKPVDKQQMEKTLYGVPLPPDAQAKLNAQGAALAARDAATRAAASTHANAAPPSGTAH